MSKQHNSKQKNSVTQQFLAGGLAGVVESLCCHPLDTIKTRVQLSSAAACAAGGGGSNNRSAVVYSATVSGGGFAIATRLVENEGFLALYKGLSAVMAGIVPKMAVRFSSFETYKGWLEVTDGQRKGKRGEPPPPKLWGTTQLFEKRPKKTIFQLGRWRKTAIMSITPIIVSLQKYTTPVLNQEVPWTYTKSRSCVGLYYNQVRSTSAGQY